MCILLLISSLRNNEAEIKKENEKNNPDTVIMELNAPKCSDYWNNFTYIHITKDNWSTAVSYGWCKGDGSWGNPYVIENMTINAATSPKQSGILIENSKNYYFIIRNCTVKNAPSGTQNAGIKLLSSNNGTLINNNCSKNSGQSRGILLNNNCDNNTLIGNIVKNNNIGIELITGCDSNNLKNNIIQSNSYRGLSVSINCLNNILFNNTVMNPVSFQGIFVSSSNGVKIANNTLSSNPTGIDLISSDNVIVANNSISNSNDFGISITYGNNDKLYANKLVNNGLYLYGFDSEIKSHTIASNNSVNGRQIRMYIDKKNLVPENFTGAGQIILLNCNNSIINNLNLSRSTVGLHMFKCNNNTIENLTLNNNRWGIYLYTSSVNNTIQNCTANNCMIGIRVYTDGDKNIIRNNTLNNNTQYGIEVYYSDNCTFTSNKINYNNRGISSYMSIYNLITNNTINNNNEHGVILSNCNHTQIINNIVNNNGKTGVFDGIYLDTNCDFNSIINNTARNLGTWNQDDGIHLYNYCDNNTISNNMLHKNAGSGVFLEKSCYNNTITGNNATDDGYTYLPFGIQLNNDCDKNKVINNYIRNAYGPGIYLYWLCDKNLIYNNTVYHNDGINKVDDGVEINNVCHNNTVIENVLSTNSDYGIHIQTNCDDNKIINNTITNNILGGIYIQHNTCQRNKIWLNNFTNNVGPNAIDNGVSGSNQWNITNIGNYWSNYTGNDLNDDGIGDIPYSYISGTANSKDYFPIWDDGDDLPPVITINLPINDTIFEETAPLFNITIIDSNLHFTWYVINNSAGWSNPYYFTTNESINQEIWQSLSNGDYLIRFYANDTIGHEAYKDVIVEKYIPPSTDDDDDNDSDDKKANKKGGIGFGDYYIIIALISFIALIFYTNHCYKKLESAI